MDTDGQYLRLLSIFHYIVGAIIGLIGCVPFIHLGLGIAMVVGAFDEAGKEPPPPWLGWIFIVAAVWIIALFWFMAFCLLLAGRWLAVRKRYWFCFVVACIACTFTPFGTVLGVYTIIVLLRPSVKTLFGIGLT